MNFCIWAFTTSVLVLLIVHAVTCDATRVTRDVTRAVLKFAKTMAGLLYEDLVYAVTTQLPIDAKRVARYARVHHLRRARRSLPRGHRRVDSCLMMDGDVVTDWDGRKYPECPPYKGKKGQAWETFIRDFGSAMSMKEAHDETLEQTMYGTDTGGEQWLAERHPDTLDAAGNVLVQGALKHLNGASVVQERQHNKRAAHLFGHLYKHLADTRLREMIFMQAQSDGRAAYLVLDHACRRDITLKPR